MARGRRSNGSSSQLQELIRSYARVAAARDRVTEWSPAAQSPAFTFRDPSTTTGPPLTASVTHQMIVAARIGAAAQHRVGGLMATLRPTWRFALS